MRYFLIWLALASVSAGLLLTAWTHTNISPRRLQQDNQAGINEDLSCYRTVEETFATLNEWERQYPHLATVKTIGPSYLRQQNASQGHDIPLLLLTAAASQTEKHDLMIVGGHHSRELPPPETLMRWAEHLLEHYSENADMNWILNRTRIHIVPIANPDGRQIVQTHLEWMYRKNARPNDCQAGDGIFGFSEGDAEKYHGVDLNRNYPLFYGLDSGSSANPCAQDYRGTEALSEPESAALYQYATTLFPAFMKKGQTIEQASLLRDQACLVNGTGIFLDVHSSGDFVYFPWGYEDTYAPNHHALLTLATKLAAPGDYTLWGPAQAGFQYFVSGDITDSLYGMDCVAALGYELGSEFYAPCTELEGTIVPIMFESLLYAAKCVRAPYRIPQGPDILNITIDNHHTATNGIFLTVQVSDDALIVPHAVFEQEKSQSIADVQVFVNVHPYEDDNAGFSMEPQDGAWDSPNEVAMYTLDTTGLPEGRHVLYFQAKDTAGFTGPVSAQFLDIPATAVDDDDAATAIVATAQPTGDEETIIPTNSNSERTANPTIGSNSGVPTTTTIVATAQPTGDEETIIPTNSNSERTANPTAGPTSDFPTTTIIVATVQPTGDDETINPTNSNLERTTNPMASPTRDVPTMEVGGIVVGSLRPPPAAVAESSSPTKSPANEDLTASPTSIINSRPSNTPTNGETASPTMPPMTTAPTEPSSITEGPIMAENQIFVVAIDGNQSSNIFDNGMDGIVADDGGKPATSTPSTSSGSSPPSTNPPTNSVSIPLLQNTTDASGAGSRRLSMLLSLPFLLFGIL